MAAIRTPTAVTRTDVGIAYWLIGRFELTCRPAGIVITIVPLDVRPRASDPPSTDAVNDWADASLTAPAAAANAKNRITFANDVFMSCCVTVSL